MTRRTRFALVPSLLASALLVGTLAAAAPGGAAVSRTSTPLFSTPSSIASIGPWIVVANRASSSLTVLAASNGARVGAVSSKVLGVVAPTSLVAEMSGGHHLAFVAGDGGKVAELELTAHGTTVDARRVRILRPAGCTASAGAHLAFDAYGHLFDACVDGVVTEWRSSMGSLVKSISAAKTHLTDVTGLALLNGSIYLTNAATTAADTAPDGVTRLSVASGARVLTVTNATSASYAFSSPSGIASDGTHLWEINAKGDTVDELTAGTLGFLSSSGTNLTDPGTVLATASYVWVSSSSVNGSSSMVTQFDISDNSIQSPWMMCNSNGPYKFGDPTGFTLHDSMLWVANSTDNLLDEMSAASGALVATYT